MKIKHIVYNEHFLFSKNDLWGRETGCCKTFCYCNCTVSCNTNRKQSFQLVIFIS